MDTITQGLLGAATAQCGFRQKIGRDATWAAFFAGVLPDVDIFFAPIAHWLGQSQPMDGLRYHRGLTHSLVAIPVLALLTAGLWWALRRWWLRRNWVSHRGTVRFGWLYACCFVAVATHGLLDACTSYGTQLLWPFSADRLAWDCVPIIDLIYTPILILTLLLCYVARKLRRRKPARAARISLAIGILGMALSTGYLVAGRVCHDIAKYRGMEKVGDRRIVSAEAYPMVGSIFLWRVVVQTPGDWYVLRVHLFGDRDRVETSRAAKRRPIPPEVTRARETEAYKLFNWFAGGQLRAVVHEEGETTIVEFHDMRYAWRTASPDGLWFLRFQFTPGGVTPVDISRPGSSRGREKMIEERWRDLWNP
ncbi:MAG: metal-dependent hydrolase [Phycisphaerae bacterium]|nr:metal-dependent hydrolase [Phycisphaerae bacterium]